jgi:UDP-glucose 4-epimerase
MKKFVVTGCNGYIGSHMCYELKRTYPDCFIIGVDKNVKSHLRHLYDDFSSVDLSLNSIYFSRGEVDCVFHFAAYISVEEGEREPWLYYRNNVGSLLNTLDMAKKYKVRNFIFSSTAAVYGETTNVLFGHLKESQLMSPASVYGKTKAMCETILEGITDINIGKLRYFNACGRNVEANLYEEHEPETHLIPLLARNKTATIYGNNYPTPDGTAIRDYVHVIDICRAHIATYEYLNTYDSTSVTLNIGSGKGYSVKEVVDKANEVLHNGEMKIEYKERRPGDVPYLVADNSKLREILSFQPQYTLDDIMDSMKLHTISNSGNESIS